jgi:hypothetical protein
VSVAVLLFVGFGAAITWFFVQESKSLPLPRSAPPNLLARAILAAGVTILALRLLASGYSTSFNPGDDFQAYFVFPEKMVQTGSMGIDPFSGRRHESALGGSYFLGAIPLFVATETSANIIEGGVGLFTLWLLFFELLRKWTVPPILASSILFVIAFVPPPKVNVTSLLLSAALVTAVFHILADKALLRHLEGVNVIRDLLNDEEKRNNKVNKRGSLLDPLAAKGIISAA